MSETQTVTNAVKAIFNANDFVQYEHEVSTTVKDASGKSKYEKIGSLNAWIPTLKAFGIDAQVKEYDEAGLPVYADDKMDYLFSAVVAAIKARTRNALQPKTATLREGATIAESFEQLLADASGGRAGAALVAIRDVKNAFAAWLKTSGKSEGTQRTLCAAFNNVENLATANEKFKQAFTKFLERFVEEWDSEQDDVLDRASRYIQRLEEAASAQVEADDLYTD